MGDLTFRKGNPQMVDYTPTSGNVDAGDVVLVGNTTGWANGIAHSDIESNTQGQLSAGGGIYEGVNLDNAADGAYVYWDAGNTKFTTTNSHSPFGYVVEDGGGGANSNCQVLHKPYAGLAE